MLLALEECESRILDKCKKDDSDMDVDQMGDTNEEESVDDNVEKHKGSSENVKGRERNVKKPKGPSENTKRREKNIEENKQ